MEFLVFKCSDSQWRWQLRGANGKVLAASADSFKSETDCLVAVGWVKRANSAAVVMDRAGFAQSA